MRRESLTSTERALRGRIGAFTLHARHDPRATTAAARLAFNGRFVDLVDPERTLPEDGRRRRVEAARNAYSSRLAYRSVLARRTARARPSIPPTDGDV